MKLHRLLQKCSFFLIKLAAFWPEAPLIWNISKVGVGSILGNFAFVGWVEPTPGIVGFRCTQPNLHFTVVIANCETQQRPISEPSPKSFFLINLAAFQASGFAYMKLHFKSFFFRSDWTLAARRPGYHPSISSNRSIPIDQYLIPNTKYLLEWVWLHWGCNHFGEFATL